MTCLFQENSLAKNDLSISMFIAMKTTSKLVFDAR
jgi:hypothetical protein